jgi:hypothetical protein
MAAVRLAARSLARSVRVTSRSVWRRGSLARADPLASVVRLPPDRLPVDRWRRRS